MPFYEYKCTKCDEEFEVLQKVSDPAPPCSSCGGEHVERLLSKSAFVLKGGGWYADGYGSSSGSKDTASETKKSTEKKSTPKESKKPDASTKKDSK